MYVYRVKCELVQLERARTASISKATASLSVTLAFDLDHSCKRHNRFAERFTIELHERGGVIFAIIDHSSCMMLDSLEFRFQIGQELQQ